MLRGFYANSERVAGNLPVKANLEIAGKSREGYQPNLNKFKEGFVKAKSRKK